jgi:peptide/nickel transport system substrate-binding protein
VRFPCGPKFVVMSGDTEAPFPPADQAVESAPAPPPKPKRSSIARALDTLAVLVVLYAVFHFFVQPRLSPQTALQAAPPLTLAALDGGDFSLASHRGHVVFLDFWASWCEPCQQSIPLVEHFAKTHPNVDVIPIDSGEARAAAAEYANAHGMEHVALDPETTATRAYGVAGLPTMLVIDPDGNVRAKWIGFNPAVEDEMAAATARYSKPQHTSMQRPLFDTVQAAVRDHPLTLAIEDEPNTLNTIRNTPFGWQLGPFTQGYLFLVNDRGELVPDRAMAIPTRANGGISADGRTITYRIRTGRWSDGAPFDAHDVAFTIDALRNPKTSVPDTSAVVPIRSYEVPRPDTLVVHLKEPSAPFVASFLTEGANDPFSILPRHIAAKYASLDRSSLDTDPVGLGPFRLRQWKHGERLSFERNPYYWRGPAKSDRIDVLVVPNAQTRLILAQTNQVDAIEVSGQDVDIARRVPALTLNATTTNIVDYLQINDHTATLRDHAVRMALVQAIDRNRLAAAVYRGTLVPTDAVQLDPRYRATEKLPAYDPIAAQRVLKPKKITLNFAIAGHWRNSASVAIQIASQLANAGINTQIRTYTEATFWGAKESGGILENARYDIALTSWSPALDPDRSYLFACKATPPGGGNSMFFCDKRYDSDEANGAHFYDPAQRAPYYCDAGNRLIELLPIIPLGFERRTYAVNRHFKNFHSNPLGRDYWNAWNLENTANAD